MVNKCSSSPCCENKCAAVKRRGVVGRGRQVNLTFFISRLLLTMSRYQGYNKDLIDRFVNMGFDVDRVVDAFNFVNIDRNDGLDYELEEAYMGDITARLLGEP
jgi:hypothetical protein